MVSGIWYMLWKYLLIKHVVFCVIISFKSILLPPRPDHVENFVEGGNYRNHYQSNLKFFVVASFSKPNFNFRATSGDGIAKCLRYDLECTCTQVIMKEKSLGRKWEWWLA